MQFAATLLLCIVLPAQSALCCYDSDFVVGQCPGRDCDDERDICSSSNARCADCGGVFCSESRNAETTATTPARSSAAAGAAAAPETEQFRSTEAIQINASLPMRTTVVALTLVATTTLTMTTTSTATSTFPSSPASAAASTPTTTSLLLHWEDLGAGCCATYTGQGTLHAEALYDDALSEDSLEQCKTTCTLHDDCGYLIYGWSGSAWCVALSKTAKCNSLDSGASDCGSSGNTGVHTYKYISSNTAVLLNAQAPSHSKSFIAASGGIAAVATWVAATLVVRRRTCSAKLVASQPLLQADSP